MRACVIIPAYNEARTVQRVVEAVRGHVPDVLVVNDGSADNTEEVAKQAGAVVINSRINSGKGKALRTGFAYAIENNYDAVITMDADGQHSPDDIKGIIDCAERYGVSVVVGNRMTHPQGMPAVRFITNLFMSFIISSLCGQVIPDTQCGFRLIKSDVLRSLRLISLNYEIESEFLIKASRAGFKIMSVPVESVYNGQGSLINPILDTWRFLVMLGRVMLGK